MKTMCCIILDRSGSMSGRESDVVGGVNNFLAEQKKLQEPCSIALVRFDSAAIERFRAMGDLQACEDLTATDFQPRGATPLLDAIGSTITELDTDWAKEQPERAIVVIVTDGYENASHEYTKAKVKEMIEARQNSGKWAFIYLGANVDSFAEAGQMGVMAQNTANYFSTSAGTHAVYDSLSLSVKAMRATGQTLASNLGGDIGEDGKVRFTHPTAQKPKAEQKAWEPPT